MNTKVMHNLTCGLFMLSSRSGEKTGGCIINTVMQVTSKPLRITITNGRCNIDKVAFVCPDAISEVEATDADNGVSYNLSGQKVDAGYRGIVIRNGKKLIVK